MQKALIDITLEYCAPCGYTPRAISLTAEIMQERDIEKYIGSWRLIPSSKGVFEVVVNGELVFSKKALGRHAEPGEIKALLLSKLDEVYPDRPPSIPTAD
jgi:selenoprotein W-related protein